MIAATADQFEARLTEALTNYWDVFIDPLEALRDETTGRLDIWKKIGGGDTAISSGLEQARNNSRVLVAENEWAINAIENRISYIVGSGYIYTVQPKKEDEVDEGVVKQVQEVIDDFVERNKWVLRQQEYQRRFDRDGEFFLRLFPTSEGELKVRFVEPEDIKTPSDMLSDESSSFGVKTDPDDVETVLGYWVQDEFVEAKFIQHRKANVDLARKRGIPLLFPVESNLKRAGKILRNMSAVAALQAAIGILRKRKRTTSENMDSILTEIRDASLTDSQGKEQNFQKFGPASIVDIDDNTDYEFPSAGIDASRFVAILQAELRAIASRLVMPEFMLTSDASNANYASTQVAESPAVKKMKREQAYQSNQDKWIMGRQIVLASNQRILPEDIVDKIKISVETPRIEVRDRVKDVQADSLLRRENAISKRTMMIRDGLDPDVEERQIELENETSIVSNPFAGTNQRRQDNEDQETESG